MLSLQEFMLATNLAQAGTPEEKLRWAFKMYDKDGSGAAEGATASKMHIKI
jgi:Ca2+-binding EF-hand superfamily protein